MRLAASRASACIAGPTQLAAPCQTAAATAAAAADAAAAAEPRRVPVCTLPPRPQTATLLVLNACLVGCILVCASLLLVPAGLPSELVPHVIGLLLLAAALAFSVNW